MTAADITTGELPPTLTFARRRWVWLPATNAPDYRLGTLHVVQEATSRNGRKRPAKVDAATYGVVEDVDPQHPHPGVRVFMLVKDGSAAGEIYSVVVGESHASCSCVAAQCKVEVCKHRCGVRALLSEGLI